MKYLSVSSAAIALLLLVVAVYAITTMQRPESVKLEPVALNSTGQIMRNNANNVIVYSVDYPGLTSHYLTVHD